uniref:Uncharacterized protein n=1 Tax=Anguilla anguilla TaxID=7936 RepID=A0A0E9VWZ9_ANGAN
MWIIPCGLSTRSVFKFMQGL